MASSAEKTIGFLGAAGTVTGSKFLLCCKRSHYLVDCGLFQGYKNLRQRNWRSLPIEAARINHVILTHAHIDHSGWLPVLCREGFAGKILATPASRDLCRCRLPDSGFIQEKDVELANRHGWTRHKPARPLYTKAEAEKIMRWLSGFERPPRKTFIVHGEADAADAMRLLIEEEPGWDCVVPEHQSEHVLASVLVRIKPTATTSLPAVSASTPTTSSWSSPGATAPFASRKVSRPTPAFGSQTARGRLLPRSTRSSPSGSDWTKSACPNPPGRATSSSTSTASAACPAIDPRRWSLRSSPNMAFGCPRPLRGPSPRRPARPIRSRPWPGSISTLRNCDQWWRPKAPAWPGAAPCG